MHTLHSAATDDADMHQDIKSSNKLTDGVVVFAILPCKLKEHVPVLEPHYTACIASMLATKTSQWP
jgi:hypothetical protein